MKTVLIVDDDQAFTENLKKALISQDGFLKVLTSEDHWTAAKTLSTDNVDLVVAGLKEPLGKDWKFLSTLGKTYMDVPVIVVCATCPPEVHRALCSQGFYRCFVKPVEIRVLVEAVREVLHGAREGFFSGLTLGSLLQIVELEKKTCTLRVESEGREGHLYIKDGDLLDAEAGDLAGDEAAFEMMTWEETRTEIQGTCWKTDRKIPYSLSHLLLEALRRKDEAVRTV
jgi:DNA-binding response OmpR family regulator